MNKTERIKKCTSFNQIVDVLNDYHIDGNDVKYNGDRVICVFSDGEVCSTKGGDLFNQRNMHQLDGGILPKSMQLQGMKSSFNGYGMVVLESFGDAVFISKLKELKANFVIEQKRLDRAEDANVSILHLKPILSYEDSPEVLGLYNWGLLDEEWQKDKDGREYRRVKYMTNDANLAIRLTIECYGNLLEMYPSSEDGMNYVIETIQYY